jgi:hypothetical protein
MPRNISSPYQQYNPNPKPQTPNPKPQTPNPKPQTPNQDPEKYKISSVLNNEINK